MWDQWLTKGGEKQPQASGPNIDGCLGNEGVLFRG